MEEPLGNEQGQEATAEELGWSVPLEGDTVPLEDIEETTSSMITPTLVRKILCNRLLNCGALKSILIKA